MSIFAPKLGGIHKVNALIVVVYMQRVSPALAGHFGLPSQVPEILASIYAFHCRSSRKIGFHLEDFKLPGYCPDYEEKQCPTSMTL